MIDKIWFICICYCSDT